MPLAITQEFYHVGIAPNELDDVRAAFVAAGAEPRRVGAGAQPGVPGPEALDLSPRPVHRDAGAAAPAAARHPPRPASSSGSIPRATSRGRSSAAWRPTGRSARSGLEASLDSLLTGRPGEAVLLKDRAGRRYDSPGRKTRDPVAGNDVTLTHRRGAAGDRRAGTRRRDRADAGRRRRRRLPRPQHRRAARAGVAAGGRRRRAERLDLHRPVRAGLHRQAVHRGGAADARSGEARPTRSRARTGSGSCRSRPAGTTRRIADAHADAGHAHAGARDPGFEQHRAWPSSPRGSGPRSSSRRCATSASARRPARSFPASRAGSSRCPHRWQPMYTRASLAMGYEFGVTPVQLAAAYAAIANDGVLLAPTLVREVRDPAGNLLYRHRPEPVRRVVPLGDRGPAARVPARGGGGRRDRASWRSWRTTPCWGRPAPRSGS